MGVDDDARCLGLTEDLGQAHRRDLFRRDQVRQHGAGPDRGQLVHVPDQQHRRLGRHGPQQLVHQRRVHHRDLVDHQQVGRQRAVLIALEGHDLWVELQQPVDGLGLATGGFRQALGGAPGRRAESHLDALGQQDAQDGIDHRGLADAGAAGNDHELAVDGLGDGCALGIRQGEPGLGLDPGQGLVGIDVPPGWWVAGEPLQAERDALLGALQRRQQQHRAAIDLLRDQIFLRQLGVDRLGDDRRRNLQQLRRAGR